MSVDAQRAVVRDSDQSGAVGRASSASDEGRGPSQAGGQPRAVGPRHGRLMHQTTLSLGDQTSGTCYTTTHSQSYSGRSANGQVLLFFPRDPSCASQHSAQLDLSNAPSTSRPQTHSRSVHSPKDVVPSDVLHGLGRRNRSRNREGVAMMAVTNPREPTCYWTTYRSEHACVEPPRPSQRCLGKPTLWHQHDIVTGEARGQGVPVKTRRSGDRALWAARRWETDCCAYRLT
ncbi:uncharacterized protein LOC124479675 isoform X2 [Hypomesus transpacificus]|uniref:uncharacterized protein LOC124479675 isoform X2 n=1 Tax=Hypomesus transpacificus TaxID=137520 RepID=UPI001F0831ED|nr:uncharacterized protein LOC124479675 isoform X2 [Hypomesus transpacificus]